MTVYQGSRYVTHPVAKPPTAAKPGSLKPILIKGPAPVPTLFPKRPTRRNTLPQARAFREHVVIQGERFDLLAATFLGDPRRWWMIADLNPEVFFPFDDLVGGSVVRIPSSATAQYTVTNQTFLPQVFARVFDAQGPVK